MSHKKLIAFIILINYFQIKVFCFIDYNSVQIHHNLSSVILKNVDAKRNYMFKWLDFSDGHTSQPQLVVSLPPQLRLRQVSALPTQVKIEVTDTFASFRIREASLMHQGFYTAFKVINNSIDGNAYHFVDERRNFYINVIGNFYAQFFLLCFAIILPFFRLKCSIIWYLLVRRTHIINKSNTL